MEHLPVVTGGSHTDEDLVPYVATQDYRNMSLEQYLDIEWPSNIIAWADVTSIEEIESILQTWFFFGLLKQVLGDFFFDFDYIRGVEGSADTQPRKVVTTKNLIPVLEVWVAYARQNFDADTCLRTYRNSFAHISQRGIQSAGYLLNDVPISRSIRINILSSANLISYAIMRAFGERPEAQLIFPKVPFHPVDRAIMQKNGWCLCAATRCWNELNLESQMLLRTAPNPDAKSGDHSLCTAEACTYAQIDVGVFKPLHTAPDCGGCNLWSVDEALLNRIIDDGSTPILQLTLPKLDAASEPTFDDFNLTLMPRTDNEPYVAISHVWAHGMGNPVQNALPQCQLKQLMLKLCDFRRQGEDDGDKRRSSPQSESDEVKKFLFKPGIAGTQSGAETKVYFWLDTLCCPAIYSPQKKLAISRMKDIYSGASDVLVLDRCLSALDSKDRPAVELAMYVSLSTWAQRVWTLQEGVLSLRLWFRFKDVSLRADWIIWELLEQKDEMLIAMASARQDFASRLDLLNRGLFKDNPAPGDWEWDLAKIIVASMSRSLSVKSDEFICLMNLINTDALAAETAGEKQTDDDGSIHAMRFWDVCRRKRLLDHSIIFNCLPKMTINGYRWAPKSLLYENHKMSRDQAIIGAAFRWTPRSEIPEPDDMDARGFVVPYNGVILSASSTMSFKKQVELYLSQENRWMLLFDQTSGRWSRLMLREDSSAVSLTEPLDGSDHDSDTSGIPNEGKFALIFGHAFDRDARQGIFAAVLDSCSVKISEDYGSREAKEMAAHRVRSLGQCLVRPTTAPHQQMLDELRAKPLSPEAPIAEDLLQVATAALHSCSFPQEMLDKDDGAFAKNYIRHVSYCFTEGQYLVASESFDRNGHRWIVD